MEFLARNESTLRLGVFLGMLAIMAIAETRRPRRGWSLPRWNRWLHNLTLTTISSLFVRLLLPTAAVGAALYAQEQQYGLFNQLALPAGLELVLAVVILDGIIWLQHRLMHRIPLLWRLHRVHHADLDYDVTTGVRFHPLEMFVSMLIKMGVIQIIGPAVAAVVIFEIVLNGMAVFNHANVALPGRIDAVLRWLVVTPDMHRVHHSIRPEETHSNFGFNLSCWDRLFGSYRAQPADGHTGMTIGLPNIRNARDADNIGGMLGIPFRNAF